MQIHTCTPPAEMPAGDPEARWACPACGRIWEVRVAPPDVEGRAENAWVPVGRAGDLNSRCTESYGVHHICRGILIGREPQLVDVEAAARGRAAPGRVAPREEVALARRSRRRGVTQFGRSPRSRARSPPSGRP